MSNKDEIEENRNKQMNKTKLRRRQKEDEWK